MIAWSAKRGNKRLNTIFLFLGQAIELILKHKYYFIARGSESDGKINDVY